MGIGRFAGYEHKLSYRYKINGANLGAVATTEIMVGEVMLKVNTATGGGTSQP